MSRFAINIYSPVNLKKTFSTFFLLKNQHIIQRLGSFCMCKRNKLSIISLASECLLAIYFFPLMYNKTIIYYIGFFVKSRITKVSIRVINQC